MHLVMFDIDGTLVNTASFEDECYSRAIEKVVPCPIDTDWSVYANATDSGILDEIISKNGLDSERDSIHREVKQLFITYIGRQLQDTPATEIDGAGAFIQLLKMREDVTLAIATGGWEETAKLKLKSAGIDYSNMAFASGSDHKNRMGIMEIAENKCFVKSFISKSYFGDAVWDKKACHELKYNFILVGNRLRHPKQIDDFSSTDAVLSMLGL